MVQLIEHFLGLMEQLLHVGVGRDVPPVMLPLPLRGSLRVMVDSVNDLTAR